LTLALSALLILPLPGQTVTLHVSKTGDGSDGLSWPTAYTAIGDALAVSASGDEIWVAMGTYNETIRTVTGTALFGGFVGTESLEQFDIRDWDLNKTIIDAIGLNSTVILAAEQSIVDGFTVTNGRAREGGGIGCENCAFQIANCLITNNEVRDSTGSYDPVEAIGLGAGIYCRGSKLWVANCRVADNQSRTDSSSGAFGLSVGKGGGIYCGESSNVTVIDSSITLNTLEGYGAGMWGGYGIMQGAGIYCEDSVLTLKRVRVVQNRAFGSGSSGFGRGIAGGRSEGGGIFCTGSSSLNAENCIVSQNKCRPGVASPGDATTAGCGIVIADSASAILTNCAVTENTGTIFTHLTRYVYKNGAGIYLRKASSEFYSCTIAGNFFDEILYASLETELSGLSISNSTLSITNSIVVGGTRTLEGNNAEVSYSNVEHGYPGPGNIDADPLFVDPDRGDFRLQYGSPCIDAGTMTETLTDLDGNPRPVDIPGVGTDGPGAFDMGAYEYQFPKSDLNKNGYLEAMDLFILGSDWMKVSGVR
jgi:hypothetical protein